MKTTFNDETFLKLKKIESKINTLQKLLLSVLLSQDKIQQNIEEMRKKFDEY